MQWIILATIEALKEYKPLLSKNIVSKIIGFVQTTDKPPFEIMIIFATTEVLKQYKPLLSKNIVSKIDGFVRTVGNHEIKV